MWRHFLGKKAKVIGIEMNPDSKKLENFGFEIFIGDQSSEKFWKKFFKKLAKLIF